LALLFAGVNKFVVMTIVILITLMAEYVIAFCYGLEAIPAMDQATFLGQSKGVANFSNSSGFSNAGDREMLKARFAMMIGQYVPKMRNRLVSIAGDYYYE
jgi:hypothetical protein